MFTAVKRVKQSCPSIDERIIKMWSIHTVAYDSVIKKEGNADTCYNENNKCP